MKMERKKYIQAARTEKSLFLNDLLWLLTRDNSFQPTVAQ